MEPLHFCAKCKKPIISTNEIKKDNQFFHKKCVNDDSALNTHTSKEEEAKKFTHERRLTLNLKNKYSGHYLGKSLLTEVVRPYLQVKYQIKKNKFLELMPQISLYFSDLDQEKAKKFAKDGGLKKIKNEIQELFGDDYYIFINDIYFGSILTKIYVIFKKIKSSGQKALNKIENFLSSKGEETKNIKKAIDTIKTHSFKCLEGLKPNNIKFVNQTAIETPVANENKIKEYLQEKINDNYDSKSNWSLETKISDLTLKDDDINEETFNSFINDMKTYAENEEIELDKEIENLEKNQNFNNELKMSLDQIFKDSIFEYKITGLVSINKDNQKNNYERTKNECPNCEKKLLFHATQIEYSSKILTTQFKIGRDNWFGLGVYFSDQFDYIQQYYSHLYGFLPKVNQSFSVIAAEVYYDKSKLKQIYNKNDYCVVLNHLPNEHEINVTYRNKTVEKNGMHYVEVDAATTDPIAQNGKIGGVRDLPKGRFVGREYCVTCKEQIYPIYGLNLQRIDYCIIWRDSNFNSSTWREPLRKNKEILEKMTGYNLYTESDTKSALKLVWRKRYNKIILITNVGKDLEGKKYIDKVRKILQCDAMVLFFTNNFDHLNWIKEYPNSLFCMDDYSIKNYIINFDENGLNEIRNNIKEFYGVELKELVNPLHYPLYEKFKENDATYADEEIDCSEYNDFD
jgi:hypothetical protein